MDFVSGGENFGYPSGPNFSPGPKMNFFVSSQLQNGFMGGPVNGIVSRPVGGLMNGSTVGSAQLSQSLLSSSSFGYSAAGANSYPNRDVFNGSIGASSFGSSGPNNFSACTPEDALCGLNNIYFPTLNNLSCPLFHISPQPYIIPQSQVNLQTNSNSNHKGNSNQLNNSVKQPHPSTMPYSNPINPSTQRIPSATSPLSGIQDPIALQTVSGKSPVLDETCLSSSPTSICAQSVPEKPSSPPISTAFLAVPRPDTYDASAQSVDMAEPPQTSAYKAERIPSSHARTKQTSDIPPPKDSKKKKKTSTKSKKSNSKQSPSKTSSGMSEMMFGWKITPRSLSKNSRSEKNDSAKTDPNVPVPPYIPPVIVFTPMDDSNLSKKIQHVQPTTVYTPHSCENKAYPLNHRLAPNYYCSFKNKNFNPQTPVTFGVPMSSEFAAYAPNYPHLQTYFPCETNKDHLQIHNQTQFFDMSNNSTIPTSSDQPTPFPPQRVQTNPLGNPTYAPSLSLEHPPKNMFVAIKPSDEMQSSKPIRSSVKKKTKKKASTISQSERKTSSNPSKWIKNLRSGGS